MMAAEPIHERLCKAVGKNLPFTRLDRLAERALEEGKISADEAKILVKAEESRLRSINVDDFAPDSLAAAKPESRRRSLAPTADRSGLTLIPTPRIRGDHHRPFLIPSQTAHRAAGWRNGGFHGKEVRVDCAAGALDLSVRSLGKGEKEKG